MAVKALAELTVMCMVCDGSKVLVQNRVDPGWPGITFPGGHVEPGEAFTEAVVREVFEETGLTVCNPQLCGVKQRADQDGSRLIVLLYQCSRFSGELHSCDEGENLWVERQALPAMKLADTMEQLLPVFFDEQYSEFYLTRDENGQVKELKLF